MANDKLTFFRRWVDSISELPDAERLEVYDAIIRYGFDGEKVKFSSKIARVAFGFIQSDIDTEAIRVAAIAAKRSEAGKRGGAPKRNTNARKQTPPEETPSQPIEEAVVVETLFGDTTDPPEAKPAEKPKKPQKHRYAPEVLLTEAEYNKLVTEYGEDGARWMITKLDNYKAARGTTYKSDYRAILNWVVREYQREQQYGTTAANRLNDREAHRLQRGAEYAQYIADTLNNPSGSGLH